MLTAYDYPTAVARSSPSSNIDITLVGDSLAQVCLGYKSTTQLTLNEMIHHSRAVARGTTHPFLVADMPFGSYHASTSDAVSNAVRLVQEGRVEGVKLEGGIEIVDTVRKLTGVGIPVMAHVGLLPQRHTAMSGYKVQGRDCEGARRVLRDALALERAGAFAMVLEAVPREVGRYVTERLRVPTIGIGAGPWTSGQVHLMFLSIPPPDLTHELTPQVLVFDDVMGTWAGHKAKFVRRFADVKSEREVGVRRYAEAVKSGDFPKEDRESYVMDEKEWKRFLEEEGRGSEVE